MTEKKSGLFMVRGKLMPFELIQDMGTLVKIRSLDLKYIAKIRKSDWNSVVRESIEGGE